MLQTDFEYPDAMPIRPEQMPFFAEVVNSVVLDISGNQG